jgi:hypothetical protein
VLDRLIRPKTTGYELSALPKGQVDAVAAMSLPCRDLPRNRKQAVMIRQIGVLRSQSSQSPDSVCSRLASDVGDRRGVCALTSSDISRLIASQVHTVLGVCDALDDEKPVESGRWPL